VRGPINAMAPHPVRNKDFAQALARTLHRPAFFSTPEFALRMMLGEVADVVLTGQRVLPKRTLGLGYAFQFPTLDEALADVLK
jgi:NAD dependent epimerase/dehydratase family enzyme